MKRQMGLRGAATSPICPLGSRRTALSPTWSDPEGSSHNDFVPGRRLPPLPIMAIALHPPFTRRDRGCHMPFPALIVPIFALAAAAEEPPIVVKAYPWAP